MNANETLKLLQKRRAEIVKRGNDVKMTAIHDGTVAEFIDLVDALVENFVLKVRIAQEGLRAFLPLFYDCGHRSCISAAAVSKLSGLKKEADVLERTLDGLFRLNLLREGRTSDSALEETQERLRKEGTKAKAAGIWDKLPAEAREEIADALSSER